MVFLVWFAVFGVYSANNIQYPLRFSMKKNVFFCRFFENLIFFFADHNIFLPEK